MKSNIIILILILGFVSILFLLDFPVYNKVTFLSNEIKAKEDLLEQIQELVAKTNQLKQIYEGRKNEINKVYYAIPFEEEVPNLIVQVEALVSENGLILETLDFTGQSNSKRKTARGSAQEEESISIESYKIFDIFLSVNGGYKSFTSFLKALESNVRLMDIKSIAFSSDDDEGVQGFFTFDIELKVYYLPSG